jgi:hypothetical protein
LYGDAGLAKGASSALPGSAMPDAAGPTADRAQELLKEAEIRRAVEVHAQDSAET